MSVPVHRAMHTGGDDVAKKTEPRAGQKLPVQRGNDELILKTEGLAKRGAALFKEVNSDEALRQEFLQNPAKVISERVTKTPLPDGQASASNRFLFALLANDDFRAWMKVFNRRILRDAVDRNTRVREFAEAVIRFGDENVLASLAELAAGGHGIPGITDVAVQFVTGFATPVNQHTKAELSQNFEMSSGQNQRTSGIEDLGELISPAIVRSIIEHLVVRAKELAVMGDLRDLSMPVR